REGVTFLRLRPARFTPPRIAFGDPTLPLQGKVGARRGSGAFLRAPWLLLICFKQHSPAGAQVTQLAFFKQTDHDVLAVVSVLADHLAGAQPRNPFAAQRPTPLGH